MIKKKCILEKFYYTFWNYLSKNQEKATDLQGRGSGTAVIGMDGHSQDRGSWFQKVSCEPLTINLIVIKNMMHLY